MPTLEKYPDCPKPKWMKPKAKCFCLGEARQVFTIDRVFKNAATLIREDGLDHGMESFQVLYKTLHELDERYGRCTCGSKSDTHSGYCPMDQ